MVLRITLGMEINCNFISRTVYRNKNIMLLQKIRKDKELRKIVISNPPNNPPYFTNAQKIPESVKNT